MSKNLQDIDKIFRDGLDDHLEPAPTSVWDAVNNDLDKKQALLFKEKYYSLKRLAVAALLIIFLGVSGMFYFMSNGKKANENGTMAGTRVKNQSTDDKSTANKNSDQSNAGDNNTIDKNAAANNNATGNADELADEKNNSLDKTSATTTTVAENNAASKNNTASNNKRSTINDETKDGNDVAASANDKANNSSAVVSNTDKLDSKSVKAKQKATLLKISTQPDEVANESTNTKNNIAINKINNKQSKASLKGSSSYTNSVASLTNKKGVQEKLAANKKSQSANIPQQPNEKSILESSTALIETVKKVPNQLGPYSYQSPLFIDRIFAPSPVADNATAGSLNNSLALNNKKEEKPKTAAKKGVGNHPIAITVFGSPNHSFIRLKNDDMLATPFRNKNTAEKEETQGGSYSLGLLFSYGLSKNLSLQTGAVYSVATTNISPKTIYARPDNNGHTRYEFNCSWGSSYIDAKTGTGTAPPAVGDSIKVMGSSSTVSYVGVPVALSYAIRMGRFSLNPAVGFSVNFLTSGEAATRFKMSSFDQKERAPIEGLKKAYVDGSIGLGAAYAFNKRISLSVRPLLRWALSSTNSNTPIRTYQNFMSVETGFKISL